MEESISGIKQPDEFSYTKVIIVSNMTLGNKKDKVAISQSL
jgi:hypothetical protein